MKPIDIAVVGGGASGLMAALSAGKRLGPGKVVVLEKQNRVGKKLAATGNGRCNLTNMNPEPWRYHGADVVFMRPAMSAFPPETVRKIFEGLGLMTKEEAQGKVYPTSDQASSVLDVLRPYLGLNWVWPTRRPHRCWMCCAWNWRRWACRKNARPACRD